MKEILLTQDKFAVVDDHWFDYLNQWSWQAAFEHGHWYAVRTENTPKKRIFRMHRVIMNTPRGIVTDHKDGDGLNNVESNLRNCTNKQNIQNQKISKRNTTGYKGVSWQKRTSKWVAQISINGRQSYIGLYAKIEDAAQAYDEKAREQFGEFARTNF